MAFAVENIKNERLTNVDYIFKTPTFEAFIKWSNTVLSVHLLNRNEKEGENGEIKKQKCTYSRLDFDIVMISMFKLHDVNQD